FIEIGAKEDGFDLDRDGEPDNQLAGISDLAREGIEDGFANHDIVIPMEFFDLDAAAADECVKFAVYLGGYKQDEDGDGGETARAEGDCNDLDSAIFRGAAEVPDNFIDDDCDGLADEAEDGTPSTDAEDRDGDGLTIADGDCDDTRAEVGAGPEVCGDGLDNDCDGSADWGLDGEAPVCTPFDDTPDPLWLDPRGFEDGQPVIAFRSARLIEEGGELVLEAGPSLFSINIPISGAVNLDLRITGATIRARVVETAEGIRLEGGRLGGVIDANTADRVRGLEVDQIDLGPEDSLLDAIFANVLGVFLALPRSGNPDYPDCHVPDIDVDQDGIEIFCDSDPSDDIKTVDICVDGDGTVVTDEGGVQCTEARDADGNLRFQDGISIELNFETVPALLPGPLP
ncbi:MAG TPA: putative metal-binding motif-containing protein, partial [Kofleriaceae bacterium]|nr:putative metal-binding motif-containing protein [Kofleriaceae bacterium]